MMGFLRVDRGTSFDTAQARLDHFRKSLLKDPAIQSVAVFAGGRGGNNSSFILIELKPLSEGRSSASEIVNRLRPELQKTPGARMTLVPQQDIFVGHSSRAGSYSYSVKGSDLDVLKAWIPKVRDAMVGDRKSTRLNSSH